MNVFLKDPVTNFQKPARRLYQEIGYEAHDFFPADIYITSTPAILNIY